MQILHKAPDGDADLSAVGPVSVSIATMTAVVTGVVVPTVSVSTVTAIAVPFAIHEKRHSFLRGAHIKPPLCFDGLLVVWRQSPVPLFIYMNEGICDPL